MGECNTFPQRDHHDQKKAAKMSRIIPFSKDNSMWRGAGISEEFLRCFGTIRRSIQYSGNGKDIADSLEYQGHPSWVKSKCK